MGTAWRWAYRRHSSQSSLVGRRCAQIDKVHELCSSVDRPSAGELEEYCSIRIAGTLYTLRVVRDISK